MNRANGHTIKVDNRTIKTSEGDDPSTFEVVAKFLSLVLIVVTFPLAIFFCLCIVKEYERVIVFRLGRVRKGSARGPGLVFIIPCIDQYIKLDLRTVSYSIPKQDVLTRDSVTIGLDGVVYYHLDDPLKAIIQIQDYSSSTHFLAQTTLRNVSGTKMLMELLSHRKEVSNAIARILDVATDPWGIKVERVEIKDVHLPFELQRAMAAEAEAMRGARAKVAAAEGELNASRALKTASDTLAKNPISLQLRYLQTLNTISSEKNSNIIFPFPTDFFNALKKKYAQRENAPKSSSAKQLAPPASSVDNFQSCTCDLIPKLSPVMPTLPPLPTIPTAPTPTNAPTELPTTESNTDETSENK